MFRLAARNFAARNVNVAARSLVAPRLALAARSRFAPCAAFSAAAGLSKEEITTRVLDVLKSFEKVDRSKVRIIQSALPANDISLTKCDVDGSSRRQRRSRRTLVWTVWMRLKL